MDCAEFIQNWANNWEPSKAYEEGGMSVSYFKKYLEYLGSSQMLLPEYRIIEE